MINEGTLIKGMLYGVEVVGFTYYDETAGEMWVYTLSKEGQHASAPLESIDNWRCIH